MNTKPLQSVLENRKALHKNNLSNESVKFSGKDFKVAQEYAENALIHTSVKYRIATDESHNGRAEYIKIAGSRWNHQESNVSAEIGYAISDQPNVIELNGKSYLDGDENLEILEVEFFPPKKEKSAENPMENKDQKVQEILAKMQQFGLDISDIINSQKSQEENPEDVLKKEVDSIRQMGENLREKRKNGDLIPSNEEMIRRAKFIENARMKKEKSTDSNNDSENKNPEPKKIGYKPENNPEKSSENAEQKAEQLLNESIFFLFSAINNQIEKGKLKAIDIIERIKDFGKSTSKKITNSAKNKEKNSDKNSNQNDELNKNNLEKQIDSLWVEIVKARQFLENSKNEGNSSLSLAAQKNIEETIEKMLESRKKLQEKLAKKSNNSDNKKSLDETKKESEAQNEGKDSNQNNVVHDFIQNHIGHLWSEIVKARKILENSKTENGESLSPAAYANIEETIDKMMAEQKKLQEKLNKKWTNSESLKANEFSEKLAKIIEKEEEFKGHFIDVNAEIKTIEIALQHKNQKINALQNPKNFKQKASITWRKFKSFITRKPSELDQHLTEKVKLENELKTTQGALELVKNKQKELELERNTITNDFFNSL